MTTIATGNIYGTGWKRLLVHLKRFDEALHRDPADLELEGMKTRVAKLEKRFRDLEAGNRQCTREKFSSISYCEIT